MLEDRIFKERITFASVGLLDGTVKMGRIEYFSPSAAFLTLHSIFNKVDDSLVDDKERIPVHQIAFVAFHKRQGERIQRRLPREREYRISLSRHRKFLVRTLPECFHHEIGFYARPVSEETAFSEFFFFRGHLICCEHNAPIGSLLVRDGIIEEEELERGLALQSKHKQVLLGEILVDKRIVGPEQIEKAATIQKGQKRFGRAMRLGEILVEAGFATEEDIQRALEEQKARRGMRLGQVLVEMGIVKEEDIASILAKKFHLEFVDLDHCDINPDAITETPFALIEKYHVFPFYTDDRMIKIAMSDPLAMEPLDMLRFSMNKKIKEVIVTPSQLNKYIEPYLSAQQEQNGLGEDEDYRIDEILKELKKEQMESGVDQEEIASVSHENDSAIAKLVNRIIINAYHRNVSDIHIEPNGVKDPILVRFRIDGTCILYRKFPPILRYQLVARIKIMANLDIAERRKPQDGKIQFSFDKGEIELRVATIPTANGNEDVVMRILAGGEPIPLDKMALSERNFAEITRLVRRPYGLILVVGPTGSGKTTTLHSMLAEINTIERKIWTAEDPVEITQKGLRQVQTQRKIGLTFATIMRAFLRADPDVIMVGEMRDLETAAIGIEASLTGHLVFSTLHTNSAPETITRLLDLELDPFSFSDALLCVLAQRLVKRLCNHCKVSYQASEEEYREIARYYGEKELEEKLDGQPLILYKAEGCSKCHNGYKGRMGIHELLVSNDEISHAIQQRASVETLRKLAQKAGMKTLVQDGIDKCLRGETDLRQILAVSSR